jgi:glycosyltransferase involved in cell wall biosynthesis
MGCNIVITRKGDAYEYFENDAYYCDPDSPESIYQAIELAASNKTTEGLSSKVLNRFTWEIAAKKTMEAYLEILNTKS